MQLNVIIYQIHIKHDWNIKTSKDPIKYCHQSIIYTCEQQKLNVTILYNAHWKANEVMHDWNIEMIKDPYLRYLN